MRLTHPAHSEPEARECLRILQLQNPYSVPQGQQAPRERSGQLDFLHVQNLRLAQRAPAALREESMRLAHPAHSGSEAQASVQNSCPAQQGLWALPEEWARWAHQVLKVFLQRQNSRLVLLGQRACSGQGAPRECPAQ